MNDPHCRIAAGLHIAMALFQLAALAVLVLVFGGVAALIGLDGSADARAVAGFVAAFGATIGGAFALLAVAELVAGVMVLRGSSGARTWLIVFSVLALLNVPIGTAIGAYALWALLRPEAVARRPAADAAVIVEP